MRKSVHVIFPNDHDWHIASVAGNDVTVARVEAEPNADLAAIITATRTALNKLDYNDKMPVMLALPSAWCLAATINTENLPRRDRHQSMLYELEERLPLPMEKTVTQFITSGSWATGVSCETLQITPIIDALANQSINIVAVCPAAMLALQFIVHTNAAKHDKALVILGSDTQVDIFYMEQGRPKTWHIATPDAQSIKQHIGRYSASATEQPVVLATRLTENLMRDISQSIQIKTIPNDDRDVLTTAALGVGQVLLHRRKPWINLHNAILAATRGRTISLSTKMVTIAVLIFAIAIPVSLFYRSVLYQQIADDYKNQQKELFTSYFPNQRVPESPLRRLRSDLKALQANVESATSGGQYDSVLRFLHDALRLVPRGQKIRFTRLHFTPNELRIEGEAATGIEADMIEKSLNKIVGFTATMPQRIPSQSADAEITFTVIASSSPNGHARGGHD